MARFTYAPKRTLADSLILKAGLRYEPERVVVEADGIEPTTSCLQSTHSPN